MNSQIWSSLEEVGDSYSTIRDDVKVPLLDRVHPNFIGWRGGDLLLIEFGRKRFARRQMLHRTQSQGRFPRLGVSPCRRLTRRIGTHPIGLDWSVAKRGLVRSYQCNAYLPSMRDLSEEDLRDFWNVLGLEV